MCTNNYKYEINIESYIFIHLCTNTLYMMAVTVAIDNHLHCTHLPKLTVSLQIRGICANNIKLYFFSRKGATCEHVVVQRHLFVFLKPQRMSL